MLPVALCGAIVVVGCGRRAEPTDQEPPPPRIVATTLATRPVARATTPATIARVQSTPRLNAPAEKWKGATCEVSVLFAGVLDETLIVPVLVSVNDRKARITFRAWREPFGGAKGARLVDDNGTRYDMQGFDAAIDGLVGPLLKDRLKGEIGTGSGPVYADQPRADMLLFDRPTQAAEHLDLDLDARNVGEQGTIRFRISRSAWAAKR